MDRESEKRLHRCCFTGHRPEKLDESPEEVRAWLSGQIDRAVEEGYVTFLTGCGMGVDIWAGQIVLEKKQSHPQLHLIAAVPWPGFPSRWNAEWQQQYTELLKAADLVVNISERYMEGIFQKRNEWLVNRSSRLIAYYNGAEGGTRDMIRYAEEKGLQVITNDPQPGRGPRASYPQNLLEEIGFRRIFGEEKAQELTRDQLAGLEKVISDLPEEEQRLLEGRFKRRQSWQALGQDLGMDAELARKRTMQAVRRLRTPSFVPYIRDGLEKAVLQQKLKCAEEIRRSLERAQKRYPMMQKRDAVKLVFQGMLGVGHLIDSKESALSRLKQEMDGLEPDAKEPLTERISPQWFRLNLRAAKAKGIRDTEIAELVFRSAEQRPLPFTRQNVYNFCVKWDRSEQMTSAASEILDESTLPSHSQPYRERYHPAYRVLHCSVKKLLEEAEHRG